MLSAWHGSLKKQNCHLPLSFSLAPLM
jgi:hypothetical protein